MAWALPNFTVGQTTGVTAGLNQIVTDLGLLSSSPQINSVTSNAQVGTPPSVNQPNFLLDIGEASASINGSGVAAFSFTSPFPNGVLVVLCQAADGSGGANYLELLQANTTKATFQCQVYYYGGLRTSGSVTITWIAVGF